MPHARWQFWIDVGGTFTDVVARAPDGPWLRHKLLSSGVVKGTLAAGSDRRALRDDRRRTDPAHFWDGAEIRLFDAAGATVATATSERFDHTTGEFHLGEPLAVAPQPGQAYELSTGDEAPIVAIRWLLGLPAGAPLPPVDVRLGTTRGTNALLTRRGARTALVATRGLGDLLDIGYQNRPRLFELAIRKPPPLASAVVEIDERLAADGAVLLAPARAAVRRALEPLRAAGVESLAICLLHAYRSGVHEDLVADVARELGFAEVSVSHRAAPLVKLVSRGDTTVVDAYLTPVLRRYIERLRTALGAAGSDLRLLTSAGGLVSAEHFRGKDSILSGPAGGVVGFARAAEAAGFSAAIGFDMGGTSTDVARYDGRFDLEYETEKAGVRIVAPMMAIHTIAAGGGSLCAFDGVKLIVGPDSAGADPGPACYGRGGPLAVTDVNLYLGRLSSARFPFPLAVPAVERRLDELCAELAAAGQPPYTREQLAEGFIRIANANMAQAIRAISVGKGYDPREYVLAAFGGAAPQHACAVARELGMRRVLVPADASLLSAVGIGLADVVRHVAAGVYRPLAEVADAKLSAIFAPLEAQAAAQLHDEGIAAERVERRRSLDMRYQGYDQSLTIAQPPDDDWQAAFIAAHTRRYGYSQAARAIEVVAARVEAIGRTAEALPRGRRAPAQQPTPSGTTRTWFTDGYHETPVFEAAELPTGATLDGPALVFAAGTTIVVEPGWRAERLSAGELVLTDRASSDEAAGDESPGENADVAVDPVRLEIFNNHFAGIAERMGLTLRHTAVSVNVKERLDFSCAIFTAAGDLVVNAPHIPVHLGAMGETVRRLREEFPDLAPGDVLVTNDPYRGGSHLPDITVATPVFAADGALLFFAASRAHHAEIGGVAPGSMPPGSRTLAEEGVLIAPRKLFDRGRARLDEFAQLLTTARYPSRSPAENVADIVAQAAANRQGAAELLSLVERCSWPVVAAYMGHIQQAAARKVRQALARLPAGRREFVDHLDDGSPIAVAVTLADGRATFDFTGTGPVLAGNLNANRAIVTAAALYVLRCLLDEDIPLNQGVLEPVEIVLPECLLNPRPGATPDVSPAVAGGNVETSQRVVDVLLGTLGLAAASQGTMNNLLFGDATFGYYETICGGAGATPTAPGADAVHTHMTNTRLTDPEVLELRYPVRVREFALRRGSGGDGAQRGGAGVVRRLEAVAPLEVSLVTQRRGPYPPYGCHGGGPGALGAQYVLRATGEREALAALAQTQLSPGDQLVIETPGGGGWGTATE